MAGGNFLSATMMYFFQLKYISRANAKQICLLDKIQIVACRHRLQRAQDNAAHLLTCQHSKHISSTQ